MPNKTEMYAHSSVYGMPKFKIIKETTPIEKEQPHLAPFLFGSFIRLKKYVNCSLWSQIRRKHIGHVNEKQKLSLVQIKMVAKLYVIKNERMLPHASLFGKASTKLVGSKHDNLI